MEMDEAKVRWNEKQCSCFFDSHRPWEAGCKLGQHGLRRGGRKTNFQTGNVTQEGRGDQCRAPNITTSRLEWGSG